LGTLRNLEVQREYCFGSDGTFKWEGEGRRGKERERGGGNVGGGRARLPAIAIIKRGDIWRGSMLVRGAKKALTSQHDYNILS